MAYQALYRKYRPQRFAELVGQDHVTTPCATPCGTDRVGHAYLFSGPRGTGKTTTARILAKALNCTNLGDGRRAVRRVRALHVDRRRDVPRPLRDRRGVEAQGRRRPRPARAARPQGLRRAAHRLHPRRGAHADQGVGEHAAEEPRGAARARGVRARRRRTPRRCCRPSGRGPSTTSSRCSRPRSCSAHLADILGRGRRRVRPRGPRDDRHRRGRVGPRRRCRCSTRRSPAPTVVSTPTTVTEVFGSTPFALRAAVLQTIADEDTAGALVALTRSSRRATSPAGSPRTSSSRPATRSSSAPAAGGSRSACPPPTRPSCASSASSSGNAALVRIVETLGQAIVDMRGVDAADPRLVLEVALVRLSRRDAGPPLQTCRAHRARSSAAPRRPARSPSPRPRPSARAPRPHHRRGAGRAERARRHRPAPAAGAVAHPPPTRPSRPRGRRRTARPRRRDRRLGRAAPRLLPGDARRGAGRPAGPGRRRRRHVRHRRPVCSKRPARGSRRRPTRSGPPSPTGSGAT